MFSCASTCVGGVHLFCWASASFVGICMLWASIFWVECGWWWSGVRPPDRRTPTNGRGVNAGNADDFFAALLM